MRQYEAMGEAATTEQAERHASWPELFFDLVAVAGVSVVAHQLEAEQSWQHVAVLALAFTAFWIVWASVTTYGNLLADRTSMLVLFSSMAVLGVMVAAVPEIYGEHARAFAIAYVIARLIIARPWSRVSVVVDMPIVQASFGVVPWIVSIWVEGDARYAWWAVGVALDLLILLTDSGERAVESAQRRLDHMLARGDARRGPRGHELPSSVTALRGDREHLAERMGLFVLIILGEAIVQLTAAAQASEHWDRALLVAALGAFAFVSMLFAASITRGTAGLALLPHATLPPRALWLGHLLIAMSLVTVSAGLGELLREPSEPVEAHTAWMLAIGVAAYGIVSGVAHLASRSPGAARLALACVGPTLAVAVVVALGHESLRASALGWILALALAVVVILGARLGRHATM